MFKKLSLIAIFIVTIFSTTGCRLIFEPDVDAVSRLFASMPTGENRVVRELCDDAADECGYGGDNSIN